MLITAAGIRTNRLWIRQEFSGGPSAGLTKNLQIVLRTTVINGLPNSPEVIATYYW